MRSLHVGACRFVQGVLGRSDCNCYISARPVPSMCHKARQVSTSSIDWQKTLVSIPNIFSCNAYVTVPKQKRTKFDA